MRRFLPRAYFQATAILESDGESEGWLIGFTWVGITIELAIARRVRSCVDWSDEAGA